MVAMFAMHVERTLHETLKAVANSKVGSIHPRTGGMGILCTAPSAFLSCNSSNTTPSDQTIPSPTPKRAHGSACQKTTSSKRKDRRSRKGCLQHSVNETTQHRQGKYHDLPELCASVQGIVTSNEQIADLEMTDQSYERLNRCQRRKS